MHLKYRSYKKELLDADEVPFDAIKQNLKELNIINTFLGGHQTTIEGLKQLAGSKKKIQVCEIGCGGGDNLEALFKWCKGKSIEAQFTGIDIKQTCIDFAKSKTEVSKTTKWIVSDYKTVSFKNKPDVIFSSLFCHHFTDEELRQQLQWMKDNSTTGFFINDLQRHVLAYNSIKLLTKFFSSSYLVKNDAPLSVARSFKKKEWQEIFKAAGINNYSIKWKWAFRYLITFKHDGQPAI